MTSSVSEQETRDSLPGDPPPVPLLDPPPVPLQKQGIFIFKKYTKIKAKSLLIKTVFLRVLILSIQKYF